MKEQLGSPVAELGMRQKLEGVIGEMVITSNGVPANTFLKTKLFIGYQTLHWIPNCQHFCRHHFYSDNEHHIHLIHFGKCSYASSVKGKMKDCQVKGKKKKKHVNVSSKQELTQNRTTLQGHRRQYSDCLLVPWPGSLPLFSTSMRWWRRFFTQSRQGLAFYTQNPSHTIQSADMY